MSDLRFQYIENFFYWEEEEYEVKKLVPFIIEGPSETLQFEEPCVKTFVEIEENEVTLFKEVKTDHSVNVKKFEQERKKIQKNLRDCKIVKRQFIN